MPEWTCTCTTKLKSFLFKDRPKTTEHLYPDIDTEKSTVYEKTVYPPAHHSSHPQFICHWYFACSAGLVLKWLLCVSRVRDTRGLLTEGWWPRFWKIFKLFHSMSTPEGALRYASAISFSAQNKTQKQKITPLSFGIRLCWPRSHHLHLQLLHAARLHLHNGAQVRCMRLHKQR